MSFIFSVWGLYIFNDFQTSTLCLLIFCQTWPHPLWQILWIGKVCCVTCLTGKCSLGLACDSSFAFGTELDLFPVIFSVLSNPAQYFCYCNENKGFDSLIQIVLCVYISDVFVAFIMCCIVSEETCGKQIFSSVYYFQCLRSCIFDKYKQLSFNSLVLPSSMWTEFSIFLTVFLFPILSPIHETVTLIT